MLSGWDPTRFHLIPNSKQLPMFCYQTPMVAFPGYPHDFALLPTHWPSHEHWEHLGKPSKAKEDPEEGVVSRESECLHDLAFAFTKATKATHFQRGEHHLFFSSYMCSRSGSVVGAKSHPGSWGSWTEKLEDVHLQASVICPVAGISTTGIIVCWLSLPES